MRFSCILVWFAHVLLLVSLCLAAILLADYFPRKHGKLSGPPPRAEVLPRHAPANTQRLSAQIPAERGQRSVGSMNVPAAEPSAAGDAADFAFPEDQAFANAN